MARTPIVTSDDDSEIITRLVAGDELAYEVLVRENTGWMLNVAQRLVRERSMAEDCVQEALVGAYQKIVTFERRSSLKTWLHRILVNAALMKLRTRRRLNEGSIDDLLPEFDSNDCRIELSWTQIELPDSIVERSETRALILDKINELPDKYRIVLLLRDIEEQTTQDVAKLLEVSEGTVKVRLHRARAALKKLLEPLLRGEGK